MLYQLIFPLTLNLKTSLPHCHQHWIFSTSGFNCGFCRLILFVWQIWLFFFSWVNLIHIYDCNYHTEILKENGYYVSNLNSICVGVDNNSGEKRSCTISLNYKDENIRGEDIKIIVEQEGIES